MIAAELVGCHALLYSAQAQELLCIWTKKEGKGRAKYFRKELSEALSSAEAEDSFSQKRGNSGSCAALGCVCAESGTQWGLPLLR